MIHKVKLLIGNQALEMRKAHLKQKVSMQPQLIVQSMKDRMRADEARHVVVLIRSFSSLVKFQAEAKLQSLETRQQEIEHDRNSLLEKVAAVEATAVCFCSFLSQSHIIVCTHRLLFNRNTGS